MKKKFCPPHVLFHGRGIVDDEPCHSHDFSLRRWFHYLHCNLLKCPYARKDIAIRLVIGLIIICVIIVLLIK